MDSAKYPLAIIDCLLSVYGVNIGCAYNIGCTFAKTFENSSLNSWAQVLNLHFMVGSFHGHAHNCKCQLDWHPTYVRGVGLTEGEGCEHMFSMSNELTQSTCHGMQFHCHQAIEQYFAFWDEDKYATLSKYSSPITITWLIDMLGQYIYNHYWEVLTAVKTLKEELRDLRSQLNLTDEDFQRFHTEEHAYLELSKQPPIQDQLCIKYVQVLDELETRK